MLSDPLELKRNDADLLLRAVEAVDGEFAEAA
jgi:hypothetical protein